MKTNLDGNALFRAFEQFVSEQRNGDTSKAVARIGQGDHVIVAASNDKVGPLWRRQSNKDANNDIRETFRSMLVNIFEGEEKIPESVKAVMKEYDYGQGKPLTSRRISAVCRAVRECAEREAEAAQIQEDASKAENIGRLLRGESVAQIVGNARGEGWMDFANCLGDMLVLVATNAESVAEDHEVTLDNPFGGNTVLRLGDNGHVTATITVGSQERTVDTGKTPEELAALANRSLRELDDAFGDVLVDNNRSMGRALLASRFLPSIQTQGGNPGSEPCPHRTFVSELLIAKAGVSREQVDEFDNEQLSNFAYSLLGNPPDNDPNIKAAIEQAIANKNVQLDNIAEDIENHGENHVVIEPPQVEVLELNVPPPPPPPPEVPELTIPKPPKEAPPKVPDFLTLPYRNPAAGKTTTYEATIVANRFVTMLAATHTDNAEAARNALDALNRYARNNLGVMVMLASKTVSAGSAVGVKGGEKVESLLDPEFVAELAKGYVDAFSDGADLAGLTNGQAEAIKGALASNEAKPGVAKLAERAKHTLLLNELNGGYFTNVAISKTLRDSIDVTSKRDVGDSVEYPVLEKKPQEVVSFLSDIVGLAKAAVKSGTEDKKFKPGSNGARLAAKLLGEGAPLPQVLKDQAAAKKLRDELDGKSDTFLRFVFDTKRAIADVPQFLKPEIEELAAKIRCMMAEMTGSSALMGKVRLSAFPEKAVDAAMAFLRNDVALERMARLFAVANPTLDILRENFVPRSKDAENVRLMKDELDAIPAAEHLMRDSDCASFASPQGLRSVIKQFAQIATDPGMQKPDTARTLLTANNNRVLKAILASLSDPALLNAAVVPQMRGAVRRFMETVVRFLAAELPERRINPVNLSKGDVDAILSLFADPKKVDALNHAMPGIAHAFVDFHKDVGNAVQDLVNKVFNLNALKVGGVVKSPYENMKPEAIKAHLDKLDLDEILDDANINPNRPGTLAFTMNILQNYFAKLKPEAMRDILANALCTEPAKGGEAQVEGDCRLLSGVFQGTGPLLQKMLQGLDKRVLAPEYRDTFGKVFDNMKSSMPPLSDEYVNDKLEQFMKQTGGKVYYMKAGQSLGAATVGQTFLCKMKHKVVDKGFIFNSERDVEEEVVVKVMRPDVEKIAKAEKEVFDEAAKKVPGMESSWKAQYASIEKEFDFRNEAQNVKDGASYQVAGTKVDLDIAANLHAMTLAEDTKATKDVIVLKKAKGSSLDQELSKTRNLLNSKFSKVFQTDPETGLWKKDGKGRLLVRPDVKPDDLIFLRRDSTQLVERLFRSGRLLQQASGKWMKEAFFNSGCFHNDLHGGNLMVELGKSKAKDTVTMIDFGNLMKLEPGDRSNLCNMMIYSAARDVDSFCDELFALVDAHAKQTKISLSKDVQAKIKAIVDSILHKGTAEGDAGYRFLAILEELRKLGVTLPEAIYGVSRGLSRLQSSLDDLADIITKTHGVYNAFFGDVESVLPKDGIFGKDNIHGGFLGRLYNCVFTTSTGKDAEVKIDALYNEVNDGDFDEPVADYVRKLVAAKDFERGAGEIDDLLKVLHINKEGCELVKDLWTQITDLASKERRTPEEEKELKKLIDEIAEQITVGEWVSCRYYKMLATEREDKVRFQDEVEKVHTEGKDKGKTYIYREWDSRVWLLPDVINDVVDSATSKFVDRAAFVKKLGYKKAKQTLDKIEHGTDYPLGHKKVAA